MGKKEVYAYLENPEVSPETDEGRELVRLMKEVEDLDFEDPGQDYWNNFNHRLQSRLKEVPSPRRSRTWWTMPIWAGAVAVLFLVVILVNPREGEAPITPPDLPGYSLNDLDSESLALLARVVDPLNHLNSEYHGSDDDNLFQELGGLGDEDFFQDEDYSDFNSESFKELWQTEG